MSGTDPRAKRLQAGLDRVAEGEELRDVLESVADDPELARDLAFAVRLAESLPAEPRPAVRAAQQVALQEMMGPGVAAPEPPGSRRWRRHLARLAGMASAIVVLLWSAVVVSADSLPGEPLYGVKRAAEQTRLVLALDPAARVSVYLDIADNRLAEARALIDRGLPVPAATVEDLIRAQTEAREVAFETGDPALLDQVERSVAEATGELEAIVDQADGLSRDVLDGARDARTPSAVPSPGTTATAVPGGLAVPAEGDDPTATRTVAVGNEPAAPPTGTPVLTATSPALPQTTPTGDSSEPPGSGAPTAGSIAPTAAPPTAIEPATVEPTMYWREAARATDLAREEQQTREAQTQEARPTRTRMPPRRRLGDDPIPSATPEAQLRPTSAPTPSLAPPDPTGVGEP